MTTMVPIVSQAGQAVAMTAAMSAGSDAPSSRRNDRTSIWSAVTTEPQALQCTPSSSTRSWPAYPASA